jgi:methyl-accepting chemotaxis protein
MSITKRIFASFIAFGLTMGLVFPVYSYFFVVFKDGMFPFFMFGAIIAGLIVGISNFFIYKLIINSVLNKMEVVLDEYKDGNYEKKLLINSKDVIGNLTTSINELGLSLDQVINHKINGAIKEDAIFLNDLSKDLKKSLEDLNKVYIDLSILINSLTNQIKSNDSSLEATNVTVNMMRETFQFFQSSVEQFISFNDYLKNVSNESENSIAASIDITKKLSNISTQIVDSLKIIGELSDNMYLKLTDIVKISDKTNILALNSSIEAARAGEYGKGFSVVATEIKSLADETKEITDNIQIDVSLSTQKLQESQDLFEGFSKQTDDQLLVSDNIHNNFENLESAINNFESRIIKTKNEFDSLTNQMFALSGAMSSIDASSKSLIESSQSAINNNSNIKEAIGSLSKINKNIDLLSNRLLEIIKK